VTVNATNHADFIPEIWAAQALGYLKANTVMVPLVNRDYSGEIAQDGDTVNIPIRGSLTVRTKAAGGTVTSDSPTGSKTQITMLHRYVSFLVEDVAEAQARPELINGYIGDGMKLIGEDMDAALLALYSGFSATPVDATSGIAATSVTSARRILTNAKVPQSDRHIVWHPDAVAELLNVEKFTSAEFGDTGSAVREAIIGRKFGFNHFENQLVPTAGGECKNLAFHRDAMALVTRRLPDPPANTGVRAATMSEDGVGLRVLWGYNMQYMAVQVNIDILYGVAELRDSHAVVIRSSEV
jgi:hypothetical protein